MRVFLFFCLFSYLQTSAALVNEKVYINHYFVNPKGEQSFASAMRSFSPIRKNGKTFYAHTEWNIEPVFQLLRKGNLCYVDSINVNLKIKFTLPKMHSDVPMSEEQQKKFDALYDALYAHEMGHKDLGRQAADDISALLHGFPPNIYCETLGNNAKEKIVAIITDYKQRNHEYDLETDYGRTQGAVIR